MSGGTSGTPRAVLGVSAHYHDSAAALVVDGRVVAAAHEERFTRRKGDARMPESAIDYVLGHAQIGPDELDAVAFYESPYAKLDRILSTQVTGNPRGLRAFTHSTRTWLPDKLWAVNELHRLLGKTTPVLLSDHHLSHAASAFYPSPYEEAAIVTVDGVGEWSTTTIGKGTGSAIELLDHIEYPNSLGLLYSAFTLYCGFRINSGEYKLMGLAPYGEPTFANAIREHLIHLDDDGSFSMNPAHFSYTHTLKTFTKRFAELLGQPARSPSSPLTGHYANVAASIQQVTDEAMVGLARRARERTGLPRLCLAGGVALNVVSTAAIERSGTFEDVWIQPAAGDAGGALGAALWAAHDVHGHARAVDPEDGMSGAFLGPTPGWKEPTPATLQRYAMPYTELEEGALSRYIAAAVARGNIVAVARGRMEYGPRALGARSVLADARDPGMQQRLNVSTKFREGFRPFAPIVLTEHAEEYFDTGGRQSPYMLKVYPVTKTQRVPQAPEGAHSEAAAHQGDPYERVKEARSSIPAVTHVDYSARVQTVDADRNPFMHATLTAFHELTGVPVLVNTSLNVRGEPIVCSAEDAIEFFLRSDVDTLVVDNYVVERAACTPDQLTPRRSSARAED